MGGFDFGDGGSPFGNFGFNTGGGHTTRININDLFGSGFGGGGFGQSGFG